MVPIAFVVYQKLNWKKVEWLNVYIVAVVDAPDEYILIPMIFVVFTTIEKYKKFFLN